MVLFPEWFMIQATHGLKMKLRKIRDDRNDLTVTFKAIY